MTTDTARAQLATEGFVVFTDVQRRLTDRLSEVGSVSTVPNGTPITTFKGERTTPDEEAEAIARTNPSGLALLVATRGITQIIPRRIEPGSTPANTYGISDTDFENCRGFTSFNSGFMDMTFPWYFPAGVANALMDAHVDAGLMTQGQKDGMSLHDWAGIIGSPWFSEIMHDLAFTSKGTYNTFGNQLEDYAKGALDMHLSRKEVTAVNRPLFEVDNRAQAVVTDMARAALRARMNDDNGPGCPAARHSATIPKDLVANPHAQSMLSSGKVEVVGTGKHGAIRVSQEKTAIDDTLQLFAAQLCIYASRYGTPRIRQLQDKLVIRHSMSGR